MLNVLHIVEASASVVGSPVVCAAGLVEALRDAGASATLVNTRGSEIRDCDAVIPSNDESSLSQRIPSCSIVHLHGWASPEMLSAARLARAMSRPVVVSPYGSMGPGLERFGGSGNRLVRWWRDVRWTRGFGAVLSHNEVEADHLRRNRSVRCLALLPLGLPRSADEQPRELPVSSSTPESMILLLAPIHPVEGHVMLLKAFAELGAAADGWRIVLAGPDGGFLRSLEAAVQRKGGADRVRFDVSPDARRSRQLLQEASLLVAPSMRVRCPTSVLQAVAREVPVLGTNLSVSAGLSAGIRICEPDRVSFREALLSCLQMDSRQRAAWGTGALAHARESLPWSGLVHEYVRLYEELA